MAALKEKKLLPVNVDIESVTALVLTSLPGIRDLRGELLETFRKFDIERFDQLELYPWCLQYAQTAYLSASRRAECSEDMSTDPQTAEVDATSSRNMKAVSLCFD